MQRDKKINLWVSDMERTMLEKLAKVTGLSLSDVIRQAVREEYAKRVEFAQRGGAR